MHFLILRTIHMPKYDLNRFYPCFCRHWINFLTIEGRRVMLPKIPDKFLLSSHASIIPPLVGPSGPYERLNGLVGNQY